MEDQTPLTTLRPFDAEKAKNGAIVVTEKGESVEILKFDLKRSDEEFIIALVSHTPESTLCLYHQDGRVFEPYRIDGFTFDLRIKPAIREGWIIIDNSKVVLSVIFLTKEDATKANVECKAICRIEWEE